MARIVFTDVRANFRCQIAEGFARQHTSGNTEILSAGVEAMPHDKTIVQAMAEAGIEIENQRIRTLHQVEMTAVDLIISLSRQAPVECSVIPGAPAVVHWDLSSLNPSAEPVTLETARHIRDEIRQRVEDFFTGGYLASFLAAKRNSEQVLDHFPTGIIAHNLNRIITFFNRKAEQITGFSRREVIGRDCHDALGRLCGSQCSFCDLEKPAFEHISYPATISTKDGEQRKVEMTAVGIRNGDGKMQGVLASIHDVTEVNQLRRKLRSVQSFHGIIGKDEKMQAVYELITDLAGSDFSVVIQGESGTGKELVAGAIHGESRRAGKPFVMVNCGALPEGILESELFGHVRGAFTGAVRDKKGRFELAHEGTIFLDEIGELSPGMQVKLLRVLQEGTFERVGGEKPIHVDVRVLSATNRDLRAMVRKGQFREDLYYRLCVVPLFLPPLRERRTDIPLLVNHFIQRFSEDLGRDLRAITPEAIHCLMDYRWPGNIRELQNAIQYAFVKCKGNLLETEHFPPEILAAASPPSGVKYRRKGKLNSLQVRQAMEACGGNKVAAAKSLGVSRATLYRFLDSD